MKMKQIALASILALVTLSAGALNLAPTTTIKIIAINDFHGNLLSPGSFGGKAAGGADYLAGYVADLKSKNPLNVVVGAGDLIGASPLISAFFHDEGAIESLNRVGLEISSVGNHEFDQGYTELLRMQNGGCRPADPNSCKGAVVGTPVPFEGAKFKYLAANVVVNATGKTLLPPYAIKSFKDPANGKTVRVGFIGMTLKDTPTIVTPAGVAGLTFKDEATTVNALVPKLRALGVEAIVVLVHQGASSAPADINTCQTTDAALNPIKAIVSQLDDHVDMVVSAHSHLAYNCQMPNKAGRNITVTQASAFGRVITDVDMTIDDITGDVVNVSANNKVVDRTNAAITPNASIAAIASNYNTLVSPLANVVIGSITADLPNTGDEMPAGDLIADAQLLATQAPALGNAQIALMNRGGVRNPGFVFSQISGTESPGDVTYGEAFTVQPFGNILQTLTLTAQQLKNVLEQQWNGCQIPGEPLQTTDRILQISNGFKFTWDSTVAASTCNRIKKISLNGITIYEESTGGFQAPVNATTPYQVTVNNFMASGGDGFSVLKQGLNPIGGGQDIDALVAYMTSFKSPNAPYNPNDLSLNKPRIIKLP
jgi:5'-nucleotidase